jgi:hypothetical protein
MFCAWVSDVTRVVALTLWLLLAGTAVIFAAAYRPMTFYQLNLFHLTSCFTP